jgi:hypothetical protein
LPTFLQVDDIAGQPEVEHPRQGALPDRKLVTQPSAQLPAAFAIFSSLASCAAGDSGEADGGAAVGDVREDKVLPAAICCFGFCGLAACFGASTTTLGSEMAPPEGVAVCDMAGPFRPHSSSVKTAADAPAIKNEAFMAILLDFREPLNSGRSGKVEFNERWVGLTASVVQPFHTIRARCPSNQAFYTSRYIRRNWWA